jgi:hypothetical protein
MLGDLSHKLTPDILEGIFGLELGQIRDIYSQAGVCKPYIEPLSMEALYYVLIWMYLTGRCVFGLNAYGKIEWLISDSEDRVGVSYAKASLSAVTARLRSLTGVSKKRLWILKYLAKTILEGLPNERRGAISDIFLNNRRTFVRPEYKNIDEYFSIDRLTYQRRKLFFTKLQFHCLLDRIRIEACHVYKGSREDIAFVMRGSQTRSKSVLPNINIPLPIIGTGEDLENTFVRSLKLKKKDPDDK